MLWQHQPSLLCSSRHRFNKEKCVLHLFIWKSRVWHNNAGSNSSRARWKDTQVSWRWLTNLHHPLVPPLYHHHPLMPPTGAQLSLPRTSKTQRQSERLKCRVSHSFISNCIPYSKEDGVLFKSNIWFFLFMAQAFEGPNEIQPREVWLHSQRKRFIIQDSRNALIFLFKEMQVDPQNLQGKVKNGVFSSKEWEWQLWAIEKLCCRKRVGRLACPWPSCEPNTSGVCCWGD